MSYLDLKDPISRWSANIEDYFQSGHLEELTGSRISLKGQDQCDEDYDGDNDVAYIIFVIFSPHGKFVATIFLHTKSA